MVCQEARRGVDCSRTSIASKDDSFEADNSPWQTTARVAGLPRPSLYFNSCTGCLLLRSEIWARLVCRTEIKVHKWSTASSAADQQQAPLPVTPQQITAHITPPPIATTVLQLVYRWSEDQKKKKKLTCPPKAKSGHNGLPEGCGGTQAKHS